MKFLYYWEWNWKDLDQELELDRRFEEALEKTPEKFPKLGKSCHIGRGKGFRIIEADNEEQLMNLVMFYAPTEDWWLIPFFDGKELDEAYSRWHK
jgi:hypothetical protein